MGPPKQRALFCVLAMRMDRVHSVHELVEAVWGGESPSSAANSVHTYVSGLRRTFEPGRHNRDTSPVLPSSNGGYLLSMGDAEIDVREFERCFAQGREASAKIDPVTASRMYGKALEAWQGEAYAGVPGPFADAERVRLLEASLHLRELRAEAMFSLGRHSELVAELQELAEAYPLRERFRALLTTALYRSGRQAEALRVFRETRALLVRELGIEPGPELQELNSRILASDSTLLLSPQAVVPGTSAERYPKAVPAQLPADLPIFVGRTPELSWLQFANRRRTSADGGASSTVIIHGPAGVGKTALATRFARQVTVDYPDGQLFLDLRGFDAAQPQMPSHEALGYLLRHLGVDPLAVPTDFEDRVAVYRTLVAARRVLIVLDNAFDADQVRPLLPGNGECTTVVTSRNWLGGLVARNGALALPMRPFSHEEALHMLTTMVGLARVRGESAAANELIRLCGHLPLALLAAGNPLMMDGGTRIGEVVEHLRSERTRLDLLTIDGDSASSVRSAYHCSYHHLSTEVARVFRTIGRYGGSEVQVADAVRLCGIPETRAMRALKTLVHAHLLEQWDYRRFHFHELIRIYARERSMESDGAFGMV